MHVPLGTTPAETAERVERAAREARSAARMRDHPNIVTVHDVVVERGVPWTVMQFVPGRSLDDEIKHGGPVPVPLVEKVAAAMLAALDACHRAGIVHRDVKPANIMLAQDGTVLLTDFGIAKQAGHAPLTAPDMLIASLDYIAPERAKGQPATPASDLFSLGVTLHHAVEGISPFNRGSGMATLSAVLLEELPEATRAGKKLARVIQGLTTKDPDGRMTAERAVRMLGEEVSVPPKPRVVPPATRAIAPSEAVWAEQKIAPGQDPSTQRRIIEARKRKEVVEAAERERTGPDRRRMWEQGQIGEFGEVLGMAFGRGWGVGWRVYGLLVTLIGAGMAVGAVLIVLHFLTAR